MFAGCGTNQVNEAANADSPAASLKAGQAKAGDWPQWRGPNGDGISPETDWTAEWPADGPRQLWQAEVGIGFSSVSVADGKLYTMGHVGDDDLVWCLNAESGTLVWKHAYPCKLVDNLHEGGPAATPTVDGSRVFTVSKEGQVFALDSQSGSVNWQVELQDLLGVKMPDWGFSCSPLVQGDMLIIEAGRTVALNKNTGEVIWKTERFRPGYGSAAAFTLGGEALLAVLNNDVLLVLRARDGGVVDQFKWETSFATSACTPIVSGNKIFISTGYNRGCCLLELSNGKLNPLYDNKNMRNHMNNCVLLEGKLYGFDGNSHARRLVNLVCMDFETAEVHWKEKGLGCGSLMAAGGKLIVLSDEGELITTPATPTGFKPLAKAKALDGKCWTVPVLARGRIYCRDAAGDLVCLDVKK